MRVALSLTYHCAGANADPTLALEALTNRAPEASIHSFIILIP